MYIRIRVDNKMFGSPVYVTSYKEASQIVKNFAQRMKPRNFQGASVFLSDMEVAHVSYNGKVWEGKYGNDKHKQIKI